MAISSLHISPFPSEASAEALSLPASAAAVTRATTSADKAPPSLSRSSSQSSCPVRLSRQCLCPAHPCPYLYLCLSPDRALTEPPLSSVSATRARALTVHSRSCCPSLSHHCRAFSEPPLPVRTVVPLVQLFEPCPISWSSTEFYLAIPESVCAAASEPWFICLLQSDSVASREPQFSITVQQLYFLCVELSFGVLFIFQYGSYSRWVPPSAAGEIQYTRERGPSFGTGSSTITSPRGRT